MEQVGRMTMKVKADADAPTPTPTHLESISVSDSESTKAKGHPQTANQAALPLPLLSPMRQKYRRRFFRPNSIMSVFLLLVAGVPFIMHLHYFDPQQPNNHQHGHKMDGPPFEHGVKRVIELSDTQHFVSIKRDHYLRHSSSNTIKFYPFSRKESRNSLLPWNFHMPDSREVTKLEDLTASLHHHSGVVANSFRGRVQGSNDVDIDNDEELNTRARE